MSKTIETATVSSSVTAEKEAFQVLMGEAIEIYSNLSTVTTDGHQGIAAYMRKSHPAVKHCLDVWHWVKNVKKALHSAATKKVSRGDN